MSSGCRHPAGKPTRRVEQESRSPRAVHDGFGFFLTAVFTGATKFFLYLVAAQLGKFSEGLRCESRGSGRWRCFVNAWNDAVRQPADGVARKLKAERLLLFAGLNVES